MFERLKGNVLKLFFSKALDKTTSMSNLDLHTLLQMRSDTQTFKKNPISFLQQTPGQSYDGQLGFSCKFEHDSCDASADANTHPDESSLWRKSLLTAYTLVSPGRNLDKSGATLPYTASNGIVPVDEWYVMLYQCPAYSIHNTHVFCCKQRKDVSKQWLDTLVCPSVLGW